MIYGFMKGASTLLMFVQATCFLASCAKDGEAVSAGEAGKIAIKYVHEVEKREGIAEMRAKRISDAGSTWKVDIDIIPDGWDDRLIQVGVRKSDGAVMYYNADQ